MGVRTRMEHRVMLGPMPGECRASHGKDLAVAVHKVALYPSSHASLQARYISMASRAPIARLTRQYGRLAKRETSLTVRSFSTTPRTRTDGVFRELTDQRVQMPWIEAFRKQQRAGHAQPQDSGVPQTPKDRDLSPKKMGDSYHSVVRPPTKRSIISVPVLIS